MLYLIDGYNLLFRFFHNEKDIQTQRNLLVQFLKDTAAFLKLNFHLIFDAHRQENVLPSKSYSPFLKVIYTPSGQTADEYILERIFLSKAPSQLMVISSDNSLLFQAKNMKAQVLSIDEFIDFLTEKENKIKKSENLKNKDFVDTKQNIQRLLKIFEEKLDTETDF